MSKMLVTIAYGNYWERYGERFESMCAALNEQPDRLVIITDKPITTKYENVVYIPNSGFNDYTIGAYRQKALEICDCDWFIQFDIDDIMYPNYISNLNENVDWHVFNIKNNDGVRLTLDHSVSNFYNLSYFSFGGILNSAIKTKKLKEIGGYKTTFGWEDLILSCDLIHNKATYYVDDDSTIIRGERLMFNEGSITKAPDEIRQRKSDETQVYYNGLKTMNRKQEIQRLYRTMLGREADESGLNHYLNSRISLTDIQAGMCNSDEFKNKFKYNPYEPTTLDNKLPIFVVNLERRPDRKQLIEGRLANIGIKNYEIVKAVDGKKLPNDTSKIYNKEKSVLIHRELKKTEIACALSHVEIAKKIIEQNLEYAIILEDDAELTLEFKQFIKDFNLEPNKFDFLILGSFSSNQFFNGKLKTKQSPYRLIEKESITYLDKVEFSIGQTTIHKSHYPTQTLDYVHGTHAYMISKSGAKKLLELNYPVVVEADNIWNYFYEDCKALFTNPILVHRQHEDSDIEIERNQYQGIFDQYSDNFKKRKYHADFGT